MAQVSAIVVGVPDTSRGIALRSKGIRNMLRLILLVVFLLATPILSAQSFHAEQGGYVLKQHDQYIRFANGRWSAGIEGGARIQCHLFFWHDNWGYETMAGGVVQTGPTLEADGSLRLQGVFSARENSAPMKYSCQMHPTAEGVRVRCELEKTGPLPLASGIWMHVSAARDQFNGNERVWASPTWIGSISSNIHAATDKFYLELHKGRCVCLGVPKLGEINTEGSKASYIFRQNLLRRDFEIGQKPVVEFTVSFVNLPTSLPGETKPMRESLRLTGVKADREQVPQFERLELGVHLGATYDNPYDPEEISLDAIFRTPSGRELIVPGFFLVAHQRQVNDGSELMIPRDNGSWKVRFTPTEQGRYTWRLKLRDRTGETTGGEGSFEAIAPLTPGFVRISKADPHYLAFDNGKGFFPIGHNLPIYHTTGQLGEEAMRKFAAAKENFNRWWMSSSGFGIEWCDKLGWYRQDAAARVDLVLDLAHELGLYYMMCMDTHQDFRQQGWEVNPFNAKRGGPCQTPADWFTNETARKLYRKRLRYTVARWGYSPNVLCWEFGNEMEGWANSPDTIKLPWHKEMSDYLRSIDPFGHLITTSFWSKTGPEEYWKLKNIDIVQTHCYTNDDANVADRVRNYCLHQWERFSKPHIFGEFGIRSHASTADKDPEGWAIHNSLWAGLFSFSAGGPMPWWHENYLDKLDLYFHFTALANFTADLPLGTARWEPLETTTPEYQDKSRPHDVRDVAISPLSSWGRPKHNEFVVERDGSIQDERTPQRLLHGSSHRSLKNPPTFLVNYPQPGKFIVHVQSVSSSGLLRVWIDDHQQLERELPCGQGLGKESVFRPQWKIWETTYDEDITVDVPAGKHRIRIENFGHDWVAVSSYRFTGCKILDRPNVLVCGMKTPKLALLWLQNKESSWYNHAGNGKLGQVDRFMFSVTGLNDGKYRLEWWDTWKGMLLRDEEVDVRNSMLTLKDPALTTDVALKLQTR